MRMWRRKSQRRNGDLLELEEDNFLVEPIVIVHHERFVMLRYVELMILYRFLIVQSKLHLSFRFLSVIWVWIERWDLATLNECLFEQRGVALE